MAKTHCHTVYQCELYFLSLGIVIGVVSIVVLTAIGQGTNAAVVSNIEGMGTNLLSVNVNVRRNNPVTLKGLRR